MVATDTPFPIAPLFALANRAERISKAWQSGADGVVFGAANFRTLFITSMQPLDGEPGEADGAVCP